MNTCPCCSEQMLRHARHNSIYWFCPHCWQEMPDLAAAVAAYNKLAVAANSAQEKVKAAR